MISYKCVCCDFEQEFESPKEAFDKGWDIPPFFTVVQPCCNLCPAAFVLLGINHAETHAEWETKGRPAAFSIETCVPISERPNPEEYKAFVVEFNELMKDPVRFIKGLTEDRRN